MKYLLVPAGLLGLATLLGCAKSSRVAIESDALVAAQPQAELDAKSEPAPPVVTEAGTFSFAEDAAGKLLAKTLIPAEPRHLPPDPVAKPRAWAGLAAVERPELPLAQPALPLPSIPFAKRPPLRPQGLADSMPLDFFRGAGAATATGTAPRRVAPAGCPGRSRTGAPGGADEARGGSGVARRPDRRILERPRHLGASPDAFDAGPISALQLAGAI